MSTMTMLWIVWGVFTAVALSLLLYRSMLTRYEEDQLFLNDNVMTTEHLRQDKIVHRIHQIQPYLAVSGGAAGLMFIGLVGAVTWQAYQMIR